MSIVTSILAGSVVLLAGGLAPSAPTRTVVVEAARRSYVKVPVTVVVTPPYGFTWASVSLSGRPVPAQSERRDGKLAVTWFVENLSRGSKRTYTLSFQRGSQPGGKNVIRRNGNDLEMVLDGELLARYDVTTGPNKPYFHPVFAPGQHMIVRGFPVAPKPGESNDHAHHRGLWFTHGKVNGEDFWSDSPSRTQHTGYAFLSSGPVYCGFVAMTDWITRNGETIARDRREVRAFTADGHRILDITITVRAVGAPVVFGDTKEGTFGLRLADSMRLRGGDGHIVNSEGVRDGATWGKRARWVDYYGSVDGETVGVAILDHPTSFRHPTYWHVRDYGLFAANPFGIHDFEQGRPADAGNYTLQAGESLKFQYRMVLHRGDTDAAHIARLWDEYAEPPTVTVR